MARIRDLHLKLLALGLALVGLALCAYKVEVLGLPLKPNMNAEVWTVQAQINFRGKGTPAKVDFAIPDETPGFLILDEDFISGNYGLAVEEKRRQRRAQWAVRRANGQQTLYYRVSVSLEPGKEPDFSSVVPQFPAKPNYPEPYGSAIKALLGSVRNESADVASFTRELLIQLNAETPSENVKLLRDRARRPDEWVREIQEVLKGARIPSRILYGVDASQNRSEMQLSPWLQVHNGEKWFNFNPFTGDEGLPDHFLVWHSGEEPLIAVDGGVASQVNFSVTRTYREVVEVAQRRAELAGSGLMDFSLFSLPLQTQNVYKVLLTVPLGALLVVLLRNVVGIKTFGTFMPILIALAFRETQLLMGILLFSVIVAFGLMIRFYLERLMLLLVPRLAAVLIIVVMLMMFVSMISVKLGAEQAMSIALFPMVILAMTIERMSLVWEELGPSEALMQGGGSLLVAAIGYLIMSSELLVHLVFVFPELMLVLLAITLLLGRYTGYRLSELWRFRNAVKKEAS